MALIEFRTTNIPLAEAQWMLLEARKTYRYWSTRLAALRIAKDGETWAAERLVCRALDRITGYQARVKQLGGDPFAKGTLL